MSIASFILVPLLLVLLSLGVGLLVAWAGGLPPGPWIIPAGLAGLVVVGAMLTYSADSAGWTPWVAAVLATCGLLLGASQLRGARRPGRPGAERDVPSPPRARGTRASRWRTADPWAWPAAAGAATFLVYLAPVLIYGHPGFTGYARIVDIAHQIGLSSYLIDHGRALPDGSSSSAALTVSKLLVAGYPGGSQSVLAVVARMSGVDVIWAYQPFIAFLGANVALGLYGLLETVIPRRPWRALAAFLASCSSLLLAYGQEGGIKEVAVVAMLALTAQLLRRHPPGRAGWRVALPVGAAIAAGFATFSLGILPWMGLLVAGFLLIDLLRRGTRRRAVTGWALTAVAVGALSWPTIALATRLTSGVVSAVATGAHELGNLAVPIGESSAAGLWITPDYRFPLVHGVPATTATHVGIVLVLVLAGVGVLAALARRQWGILVVAASAGGALDYVVAHTNDWINLKAYVITGPLAIALALSGASALAGPWPRPGGGGRRGRSLRWLRRVACVAGCAAGAAVTLGVLWGAAVVYHNQSLTPYHRLRELEAIDHHFAGQGPALAPDFDEVAEYMLRDARASGLVDPAGGFVIRPAVAAARPGLQFFWDLDEFDYHYLQRFRLVVERRGPGRSRPPGNWRLAEQTASYDVWRQVASPSAIVRHFPLSGQPNAADHVVCLAAWHQALRAGRGGRLGYAPAPAVLPFLPLAGALPHAWKLPDPAGGAMLVVGSGTVTGRLSVPLPGTYTVWLGGSIGRSVDVGIDGRRVGSVEFADAYPGQFNRLGSVTVGAGTHRIAISRGTGGLAPGSGNDVGNAVGPVVLEQQRPEVGQALSVPATRGAEVCRPGARLDWVEALRG